MMASAWLLCKMLLLELLELLLLLFELLMLSSVLQWLLLMLLLEPTMMNIQVSNVHALPLVPAIGCGLVHPLREGSKFEGGLG